jgi:hypothetical protein
VPPARVLVTAPRSARARRGPVALDAAADPSAVYVRSLIRAQLRVAVVSAATFAVLLAATATALMFVPQIRVATVDDIPIVWFVLGAGIYPLVLLVAILFVRATDRNEKRYRSLAEEP